MDGDTLFTLNCIRCKPNIISFIRQIIHTLLADYDMDSYRGSSASSFMDYLFKLILFFTLKHSCSFLANSLPPSLWETSGKDKV